MNKIEKFIKQFKKDSKNEEVLEDIFTNGYCYHFACILEDLFGSKVGAANIVYNPVENHFAYYYRNGHIYDITGDLGRWEDNSWKLWEFYKHKDELEVSRIIKQCIYKEEE